MVKGGNDFWNKKLGWKDKRNNVGDGWYYMFGWWNVNIYVCEFVFSLNEVFWYLINI